MPNFRRYYIPDAVVFITAVTHERLPYLGPEDDIKLFWDTLHNVRQFHPFRLLAYAILPDHFHWLMRTDDPSGNFSTVLHSVKYNYTYNYKKAHGIAGHHKLWQSRFWDHIIRDKCDLEKHFDYIHWNLVKHGYARTPEEWPHSSYDHWLGRGYYSPGWASKDEPPGMIDVGSSSR